MRRLPWHTLLVVGAAVLLTALFLSSTGAAAWVERWLTCTREGLLRGELWRLLSGPLVHASPGHAARDLLTLTVLGVLWERVIGRRYLALLALGTVLPALGSLVWDPGLRLYLGLSGLAYAVLAAGLTRQWVQGEPRQRGLLVLVALCVTVKVVAELASGELLLPLGHPTGARPIPAAHLAGAIVGLVAGLVRFREVAGFSPRHSSAASATCSGTTTSTTCGSP